MLERRVWRGLCRTSRSGSAANDTWCWDAGRPPFPAVNGELLPDNFRYHVLRDIKPVKSIRVYRVEDDAFLAGVGHGMKCRI